MKKRYRNVAFLAELLINILVFSVSCAVLVGLFGKAAELTKKTKEEGRASAEVQLLVETAKARGVEQLEAGQKDADGSVVCYYDGDWQPAGPDDAAYSIRVYLTPTETKGGVLTSVTAVASAANGLELYNMETAFYRPNEGGGAA